MKNGFIQPRIKVVIEEMDLSRNYARWELVEDNMLLESHKQGKWIYQIAKEHRRSQNAIKMRLDIILPPKNYVPVYNPIKLILQQIHTNFQTESTTNYRIEQFDKPGDYMTARLQEEDTRNKNNAPKKFWGLF